MPKNEPRRVNHNGRKNPSMSMLYRLKAISGSSGRSAAGRLASGRIVGGGSLRTEGIAPSSFPPAAAAAVVCCVAAGASITATNSPKSSRDNGNSVTVVHSSGEISKCEARPLLADRQATLVSGGGAGPFRLHDVYNVEKTLGEGAYGTVFQARRKIDGQLVALKTMPRQYTGSSDFEREVAALQILSKPPGNEHVVKLLDLHRDNDNYYLAMEYIEGGELLDSLIANGPYSEGMAASFIRQFAEAISYVHSSNLLHADLKPENLLLSSRDLKKAKLKLADFGCASSHDLGRKEMLLPAEEFAKGCSFLHMVALGNQFELEKMLMERPHLVNFRDYDFRTPLHLAASEGHVDICRFLVRKGARVNRSDRWGGSCLDDAYRHRHTDVIQYLREQGATFGAKTQLPRFIQAASEGDVAEVEALLEFGNVDLDEGDYDHRTALHLAAGEGRAEVVELLCVAGANPNVEDRWGGRPLDDAANSKSNSAEVMQLLVSFGAQSQKDPSLRDKVKNNSATYRRPTSRNAKKKIESEDETTSSGTVAYWPPEMHVDGAKPTPATDLWAAGVIVSVVSCFLSTSLHFVQSLMYFFYIYAFLFFSLPPFKISNRCIFALLDPIPLKSMGFLQMMKLRKPSYEFAAIRATTTN